MEATPPVSLFDGYLTDPTRPHESHESHEFARVRTSSHELHELHELHEYARVRTSTHEYAHSNYIVCTSSHEFARVARVARVRTSTHEYARVRTRRRDAGTVGKIAKCKTGGVVSIFLQSFAQRNESNMTTWSFYRKFPRSPSPVRGK